jgi:hypothetical protein
MGAVVVGEGVEVRVPVCRGQRRGGAARRQGGRLGGGQAVGGARGGGAIERRYDNDDGRGCAIALSRDRSCDRVARYQRGTVA